jgi:hypothetical protein
MRINGPDVPPSDLNGPDVPPSDLNGPDVPPSDLNGHFDYPLDSTSLRDQYPADVQRWTSFAPRAHLSSI